jgi:6-phosphogluconolactonase
MTVVEDPAAVARAAADLVAAALGEGVRTLALAGGSTPKAAYELLAGMPLEWGRVTILFGDERCVPPDDPESNYAMVRGSLLARVAPGAVVRMPAELGAEAAAEWYDAALRRLGRLDLVLLGLGEDGHTCSLFPGHPALRSQSLAAPVHGAPKPPPDRVTLTLRTLNEARRCVFLATGAGKRDALAKVQRGEVPAGQVQGAEWLVDRAAAGAG